MVTRYIEQAPESLIDDVKTKVLELRWNLPMTEAVT
jgi:hypothetical protein